MITRNRSYKLHCKLRKMGLMVDARRRIIEATYDKFALIRRNNCVNELSDNGYIIKFVII